jgi:twinkle protein
MKIQSLTSQKVYDIDLKKGGENQMPCPECSSSRKHPKSKSFSYNAEKEVGYCQNCQSRFIPFRTRPEKTYAVPEWKNITDLSDAAVKYFNGRGISQATLNTMRIYSDNHFMPQFSKNVPCICFPYFRDGKLVNIKYRGPQKSFAVVKDAELIFWNIDILTTSTEVVIVEGEIDLLSCIESGVQNVISVPNGAANAEYIDNCIDLFENIKNIIICVDQDGPGLVLRNEIIRRFGAEICSVVNLGEYKDANEYLQNNGGHELHNRIKEAAPVPVSGIVDLGELENECYLMYRDGIKPGLSNGIAEMDAICTWETGRLVVVTGIPKHGKSSWVDDNISRMNILHKWKAAIFSPENYPSKVHIRKLMQVISGRSCDPRYLQEEEYWRHYNYIRENFYWIYPEDSFTIDTILSKIQYLIKRYGIRQIVLDPWNRIEAQRPAGQSETEYTGKVLDRIDNFGKRNDLLTYVVAHTTKMPKEDNGQYKMPGLYDINGSANFYNKCDIGAIIYRKWDEGVTNVCIPAVKFDHLGTGGQVQFVFNYINKRFEITADVNKWSSRSWLDEPPTVNTLELKPNIEFNKKDISRYDVSEIKTPINDCPF